MQVQYKFILIIFFLIVLTSLTLAQPKVYSDYNPYKENSEWFKKSSEILQQSDINSLIQDFNYMSLVTYEQFVHLLRKLTKIQDKKKFIPPSPDIDVKAPITRGIALHLVINVFGFETNLDKLSIKESSFKDISPSYPFYNSILVAEHTKLISGYPDGTFRPNDFLTFAEALSILETVFKWRTILSKDSPEWVKEKDKNENFWSKTLDTARLILSLFYISLAIYSLIYIIWFSRSTNPNIRSLVISILIISITLAIVWLNEILYSYEFINKTIYQFISIISIITGALLIKVAVSLKETLDVGERVSIDIGYVDYIDPEYGQLFIIDSISKRKILVVITELTKLYNKDDKLVDIKFLSNIGIGDFVNVRGLLKMNGLVIEAETVLIIASKGDIGYLEQQEELYLK